jgi:hypothetical protein
MRPTYPNHARSRAVLFEYDAVRWMRRSESVDLSRVNHKTGPPSLILIISTPCRILNLTETKRLDMHTRKAWSRSGLLAWTIPNTPFTMNAEHRETRINTAESTDRTLKI